MDPNTQLADLESAAVKLGIEIRTGDLAASSEEFPVRSGYCKIHGQGTILLDKRLKAEEKIAVILDALRTQDTESVYLAAWIRERLEPKTPINPHP